MELVAVTEIIGIGLALIAAVALAATQLFIRMGTVRGRAYDAVLVVMGTNVVVLLGAVAVIYYPDYGLTPFSWLSFILAGIFGTLLGRLFTYTSIDRIGASRTAPIVASWALIATVLGVAVLGETLVIAHAVGVLLVVGGIAVISLETTQENPQNLPRRQLLAGIALPFAGALAFGVEPIFASFGFAEGTPPAVGLVVKTVAGTLGFVLYLRLTRALPRLADVRRRGVGWFVLAGLANTVFLAGYYISLGITPVSIVTPIVVTNTLFVVIFAAAFMPRRLEVVTWRLAAAATVVVVGVILITVFG